MLGVTQKGLCGLQVRRRALDRRVAFSLQDLPWLRVSPCVWTRAVGTSGCWEDVARRLSSRDPTLPGKPRLPPAPSKGRRMIPGTGSLRPSLSCRNAPPLTGPLPSWGCRQPSRAPPSPAGDAGPCHLKGTLSVPAETSYLIKWWVLGRRPIK